MAAPADKLAASLAVLNELQDAGRVALRAAAMTRTHRERLLKNGFQPQFQARPTELRAALAMVKEPSEVLRRLLDGGHSKIAGRLAGAFRNIGRAKFADDIVGAMQAAGYTVSASDPFGGASLACPATQ